MILTSYDINYIHPRPPWMAAYWSVLLPGFGHFYLGHKVRGLVLMSWEIAINHLSHLNLAIYYSLLGEGHKAAQVLNLPLAIMYPTIYIFSMWDSYRLAVEKIKLCQQEELQNERWFQILMMHPVGGVNALEKRNPWVGAFFGMFMGGLGHLYNMRMVKALMMTGWQIMVILLSKIHIAFIYTVTGHPEQAQGVVDYQWALFFPSIMLFNAVNAWTDSLELNNLYDEAWEYRLRPYILNPSRPGYGVVEEILSEVGPLKKPPPWEPPVLPRGTRR